MTPDTGAMTLVTRSAAGEAEAFRTLVRQFHRQVYRWSIVLSTDADDAEDLAQAVWIRVHRSLATYRGDAKFSTWLYRITFNIGEERRRTSHRRADALSREQSHAMVEPEVQRHANLDAERLVAIVRSYLGDLPSRQRAVFAMADFEGVPAAEIAERLEIPVATVRTNLLKARRAIRQRLLSSEPRLVLEYRS